MNTKRWARKVLKTAPRWLRIALYRRWIRFTYQTPEGIEFKLAETKSEFEQAFQLLHDCYVEMKFMEPHPLGRRVTLYHALPATNLLIAKKGDEVIATVSITRDNPLGLPLDADFDTQWFREPGKTVAEISALAVKSNHRGQQGEILFPLLKFLYQFARHYLQVDYFQIATAPSRVDFYVTLFNFQYIEKRVIEDQFVNGAKMVSLFLDLEKAFEYLVYRSFKSPPHKDVYKYFHEAEFPSFRFPDRKYYRLQYPMLSAQLMSHFFTKLFETLPEEHKILISSMYDQGLFGDSLPKSNVLSFSQRCQQELRHTSALISQCRNQALYTIKDVSRNGVKIATEFPVQLGETMELVVATGPFQMSQIQIQPIWKKGSNYGCKVVASDQAWHDFLAYIEGGEQKNNIESSLAS